MCPMENLKTTVKTKPPDSNDAEEHVKLRHMKLQHGATLAISLCGSWSSIVSSAADTVPCMGVDQNGDHRITLVPLRIERTEL